MMEKQPAITLAYIHSFFKLAKNKFSFLEELGFKLIKSDLPRTVSFRDGGYLLYKKSNIEIKIEYEEMQFNIVFRNSLQKVNYYFIDEVLFNNASGYKGDMFPLDKLEAVILFCAQDIQKNYLAIIKGDIGIWEKISKLQEKPREKAKGLLP